MKKVLLILITIFLIILVILTSIYLYNIDKQKENNVVEEEPKPLEQVIDTPKEEVYKDDNPIKIGLYIKSGNTKKLLTEYSCSWDPEIVLGLFYAIPTNDAVVSGAAFNNVWKEYWNKYSNIDKYRIGYNLKFTLNTGEVVDQIILNPDHAYLMFPKLQCYLYDDVNLVPGKRYYHITQTEMNENTLCTSIKLVGDKATKNIVSPIELTVFTFDGNEDFDPVTSKYRGNSYYTILINRK